MPLARLPLLLPTLALCVGSSVAPGAVRAQDGDSANEGALTLLLPVGAKGTSVGRAMTALAGAEGVWWNPAGIGELGRSEVLVFRGDHFVGPGTAASVVFARPGLGSVGASYQLLDLGEIEARDDFGNPLGTTSLRDHFFVLSLGTRFLDRLNAGVNFKFIQSRFTCVGQCTDPGVTASTFAIDAGVQITRIAALPLRIGAMIAHAGPNLQVENEEQADPLPTRLRIGVAYEVLGHVVESEDLRLDFSVEVEDRYRDPGRPATYLGTEFTAGRSDVLFVRAGYVFGNELQTDGAAAGVGLRYEGFELGIAKTLSSSSLATDSEPVHLTLGFLF